MSSTISQRSRLTYLSAFNVTAVCHEALGIILLLQSKKSSSRKVFSHEFQLSANVQAFLATVLAELFLIQSQHGESGSTPTYMLQGHLKGAFGKRELNYQPTLLRSQMK